MAVRTRYKVTSAISSTCAEDKDLGNVSYEVVNDAQGEGGTWKVKLAAGAVDERLYIPNVTTATFLIVRITPNDQNDTPGVVNIRLNSVTGDEIAIEALSGSKEGIFVLSTSSITSLYASVPGSVDMDVTITAAGD